MWINFSPSEYFKSVHAIRRAAVSSIRRASGAHGLATKRTNVHETRHDRRFSTQVGTSLLDSREHSEAVDHLELATGENCQPVRFRLVCFLPKVTGE